jgi:hypothetical protein
MALMYKRGNIVRQVVPKPIEGVISEAQIVGDEVQYLVTWTDADGNEQARHFSEEQLEIAPDTDPKSE